MLTMDETPKKKETPQPIPLAECKERGLYRLNSRNLTLGVFVAREHAFRGIRTKFGSRYIASEYHWDDGPPFGTVNPMELLPDELPAGISLGAEESRTLCSVCKRIVRQGESDTLQAPWQHVDDRTRLCEKGVAELHDPNRDALFAWLRTMEAKYEPGRESERTG